MTWQPIETAPTDGTSILVFCPRQPDERIADEWFVVRWMTALEDGDSNWIVYRQVGRRPFAVIIRNPTHWTPLPAPPAGSA